MPTYETVLVVQPKLSDAEVAEFAEKTKKLITKDGGEILSEDKWGRRKLAYPIKHAREGSYLYFKFLAPGTLVPRLNQQFRISEQLLRTMTVQFQEKKWKGGVKTK